MNERLYLAGPMSGYPQFNFPLFDRVTAVLRAKGYTIVSPSELDEGPSRDAAMASVDGNELNRNGDTLAGETHGDFLARDVKLVADEVDAVVMLPGWEQSKGALLEAYVALTYDKRIYLWNEELERHMATSRRSIINATSSFLLNGDK